MSHRDTEVGKVSMLHGDVGDPELKETWSHCVVLALLELSMETIEPTELRLPLPPEC